MARWLGLVALSVIGGPVLAGAVSYGVCASGPCVATGRWWQPPALVLAWLLPPALVMLIWRKSGATKSQSVLAGAVSCLFALLAVILALLLAAGRTGCDT